MFSSSRLWWVLGKCPISVCGWVVTLWEAQFCNFCCELGRYRYTFMFWWTSGGLPSQWGVFRWKAWDPLHSVHILYPILGNTFTCPLLLSIKCTSLTQQYTWLCSVHLVYPLCVEGTTAAVACRIFPCHYLSYEDSCSSLSQSATDCPS